MGFVKLPHSLLKWGWFGDAPTLRCYIWLMMKLVDRPECSGMTTTSYISKFRVITLNDYEAEENNNSVSTIYQQYNNNVPTSYQQEDTAIPYIIKKIII